MVGRWMKSLTESNTPVLSDKLTELFVKNVFAIAWFQPIKSHYSVRWLPKFRDLTHTFVIVKLTKGTKSHCVWLHGSLTAGLPWNQQPWSMASADGINCKLCRHPGSDVRLMGCGCTLHAVSFSSSWSSAIIQKSDRLDWGLAALAQISA